MPSADTAIAEGPPVRRSPLILAFAVFLTACGGGGEEAGVGACQGMSAIESGTLNMAGREGAIVHVPDSYDPDNATPIVLVFHGGSDSPEGAEVQTGFSSVAEEEGFLAVYPIARKLTSLDRMWSLTTARQPTELTEPQTPMLSWLTEGLAEGNPDITYVENLLNELETMFCVDKSRVYATGHSMGGGFAHTLGCTLGDRIAAIGPASVWTVKGLGDCAPARPVPIMGFFSVDDPGYEGGQWAPFVELWSFHEFGEMWARLNTCTSGPEPGDTSGDSSSDVWSGCSRPVIMWTLSDGGHTWPGGSERFASSDINASETLWEFFTQHPLP